MSFSGEGVRGSAWALCVLAGILFIAPALAGPSPYGVAERELVERGMPSITIEGTRVYHSPSAAAPAETYGRAIASALAWYRGELDWQGELVVAVLDAQDWAELVLLPYPVPHAQLLWNVVVMPDSIESFPGFEHWDFDAEELNISLTFHEAGHILANQLGIRSGNHWIEELIANLFLAAHVRAEREDLGAILDGVPPRFSNPGPYDQLADLDNFYAGGGLANYAWFQFRLAEAAGHAVEGRRLAEIVEDLLREFPAASGMLPRETVRRTMERLERIAPGVGGRLGDMAGDGILPLLEPTACADVAPPPDAAERARVASFLENRSRTPLRFRFDEQMAEIVAAQVQIDFLLRGEGDSPELARVIEEKVAEALASEESVSVLAPGRVLKIDFKSGGVIDLLDGRCLVLPALTTRFAVEDEG